MQAAPAPSPTAPPPDASPRRRRRWIVAAVLLPLALLLVFEALGWPFLRGPVERAVAGALAREVSLGPGFSLHLLPRPRLAAERFVIGAPPQGPALRDAQGRPAPFADARGVQLVLPWSSAFALARGRPDGQPLHVRSLVVQRLELALLRAADGRASWRFRERPREGAGTDEDTLPSFGRLVVRDGRLVVDDVPAQLALQVSVRTEESPDGGRLQASAEGRWRDAPVQARLTTSGLLPILDAQPGEALPFTLELRSGRSELALEGRAADVLRLQALDADYRLAGPTLAALGDLLQITLPNTPAFAMQGRVRKDGVVWAAVVRELRAGDSRLGGEFRYDPRERVPLLGGTLTGAHLALPDLVPAFGGQGGGNGKGQRPRDQDGRVLPQREFSLPALAAMNADVRIDLKSVFLGSAQVDRLAPLAARLRLQNSVLRIEDIVAQASGGELRGALLLDARERDAPRWGAELRLAGVRLERFVRPRNERADRPGPGTPGYVSGALSASAQLQGRGRSTADVLASLDGQVQAWVRNGALSHLLLEMSGIDVAESLGLIVRGKDENLPLRCAVAKLHVRDGVVTPEVAVLDTADTTLVVGGSLSLARERLDLTLRALPKDQSPIALRAPVHVQGSFADPRVRPDMARIGARAAAAAALAAIVNPLAGLLALVDLGEADKAVCQEALARLQQRPPAR